MLLLSLLLACQTPQKSTEQPESLQQTKPPNADNSTAPPPLTEPEKDQDQYQKCVEKCVQSRQMEARSSDAIKNDCEKSCKKQPSPLQPDEKN